MIGVIVKLCMFCFVFVYVFSHVSFVCAEDILMCYDHNARGFLTYMVVYIAPFGEAIWLIFFCYFVFFVFKGLKVVFYLLYVEGDFKKTGGMCKLMK